MLSNYATVLSDSVCLWLTVIPKGLNSDLKFSTLLADCRRCGREKLLTWSVGGEGGREGGAMWARRLKIPGAGETFARENETSAWAGRPDGWMCWMDMDGMPRQGCSGCGAVWQATRPQKHKLPIKLECFAGCPQQQRGAVLPPNWRDTGTETATDTETPRRGEAA